MLLNPQQTTSKANENYTLYGIKTSFVNLN